ncbi:maltooligosyl trehalose synthase [Raineyella antarctica]|uniref:Maltooligosyl trehalose synthase n=1 Tax=Raineyella antarctica TaxID=1577474 RepID=A0A1G6HWP9_9ACTN|nr:malto-oligosyltrehalose synthase [Raineyella antarctica]SDB98692.1 maltooligosyl trehalose synthase [Raineyella antarctica]
MPAPSSTYRLQITPDFTLRDAAGMVGYLRDLGVGALYLSPLLTSTLDSEHGYDCVDPTQVDPQRGGESAWAELVEAARAAGIDVVVDIVPNHLGVAEPDQNPSWWSVLKEGKDSPYAGWYDIEWERFPVLLPVLGKDGEDQLALVETDDGAELHYYEHRYPVAEGTWSPGDSARAVHQRQYYRLVPWQLGRDALTYRRFFTVTSLAGLRQEDPEVFAATHTRIAKWISDGDVQGLRVDHPDGLADPGGYFVRLRELAPDAWIVGEKILERNESLPSWPIQGTSGYDAMFDAGAVFIDTSAEKQFTRIYTSITGDHVNIEDHILEGKLNAAYELLEAERHRIARLAPAVEREPLESALAEIAARYEVYRSYLPQGDGYLLAAERAAIEARPDLKEVIGQVTDRLHDPKDPMSVRFQQLCGAVMAKGVEDTAYYRYSRYIALNEVGGDPGTFGIGVDEFHRRMVDRQLYWPESMTSLSTHDTKRSEDVRARLNVLSEIGEVWAPFAQGFVERMDIQNRSLAYLLAQTLTGAGPIERERVQAYATKAMREAADQTSWTDPNEEFERVVHAAIDRAYDDPDNAERLRVILDMVTRSGWSNSLGQKLVQLTMPGVPDVYQGTEMWDDSLVDPDNRRQVDFAACERILQGTEAPPIDATGAAKLWVTGQALRLRRNRPELFTGYAPVPADGPAAQHLVGFDRGGAITLATRLPRGLAAAGGWRDTTVRLDGTYDSLLRPGTFSGTVEVAQILFDYPVALLVRR